MKKIIFLGLLLSLSAFSQVKTGGGDPFAEDYEGGATVKIHPLDTQMRKLMVHLKKQERICASGDKMINDPDIMQVYLKLSLFKNSKYTTDQCEDVNKFFTCLNDKTTIKLSSELKKQPGIHKHLAKKYQINTKEAKKIINFFSTLGKKTKQ